jgi:hypothetical protein
METAYAVSKHFMGTRRTMLSPHERTVVTPFSFGGIYYPTGARIRQFETNNFGWTLRIDNQKEVGLSQRLGKE